MLRSHLQEARQKHDIAVARLKAELKEGRDEIVQLRESDNILRRQLQEGGKRYADLEKAMTKLQVALQDTDNKRAEIEQSKQALSVELNQKVKTASQERDAAIIRGEATSNKLKAATDAVHQLERDVATTGKELDALRKRFNDSASSLQQELLARDTAIADMKRSHESVTKAKDAEIAQLKESVAKLQGQLNTVLAEAQALRKERDEAKADAAAARKDGASSADELSKRLNKVRLLPPYSSELLNDIFPGTIGLAGRRSSLEGRARQGA